MSDLIIANALILPLTEEQKSVAGYVRVVDGVITEIGAGAPAKGVNKEESIDAAGYVLMPGLINAHTHLYQVLLRAVWEDLELIPWLRCIYGCARVLRPEHFYAGSLLGCVEAIRSGVTTVCEHNFLNPSAECALETIRAIRDSGLRAVFARTIMDAGEIVPACTKEKPEEAFRRIESILATHDGGTDITFMTGPNTPPINTTPGLLKEIRGFADDKAIGISAHVAESKSVVETVRREHGKDGVIEFLHQFGIPAKNSIFAHSVHVSNDEICILKETGTSVSHNPVSNMMLGDGVAPVVEMLRQGVNVALGTDGAASNHSQDLFDTMKAASLLQKVHHQDAGVIEPYAVLRMATSGGAKALGLDSMCGTIEVGKRADLILVDIDTVHNQPVNDIFSQIVHCAKASDVQTVMVSGEILMQDRKLLRRDEKQILADARQANRDLMERVTKLSF
ncbi:MAG TPA: amidohydrolase [Candidatus Binatia bacterium]|jgi:5-methylthioadenosine/S-adenosylhomocysteine deaminase|nr:amidohydrolase [Candidatus Binatia bacterium]